MVDLVVEMRTWLEPIAKKNFVSAVRRHGSAMPLGTVAHLIPLAAVGSNRAFRRVRVGENAFFRVSRE
jgi:hypothetical protein